jgi:hypothetical protein
MGFLKNGALSTARVSLDIAPHHEPSRFGVGKSIPLSPRKSGASATQIGPMFVRVYLRPTMGSQNQECGAPVCFLRLCQAQKCHLSKADIRIGQLAR